MGIAVTVKQSGEHWRRNDLALESIVGRWSGFIKPGGNLLINALMRPLLIEVISISRDDSVQLIRMKNEEVIGTFSFK